MLGRPLVLLMVELVDGPVEQLLMEIAVIHRRAVDAMGVQLAVPLQIAGDAVVIELASRAEVGRGQQVRGQPLALLAQFFFSLIFLALGRRMEQSL